MATKVRVFVVATATALLISTMSSGAQANGVKQLQQEHVCQGTTVSVSLEAGMPEDLSIVGQVCWRGSLGGKTLQILTSGYTYDHMYWDFQFEPQTYSHAEAATAAGYATFTYDRLGLASSDLPGDLPESMSVANHAHVLHQLVQDARQGDLIGTQFTNVLSVGHSLGSGIALYEAGTYGDVDALLLTGTMRQLQPDWTGAATHPAVDDPKFAASGLPEVVITTVPGVRAEIFYYAPNADTWVMDIDEAWKQTGVQHELITIPTAYQPDTAGNVSVPVLFVVGRHDLLYCNTALGFPCDTPQDILARQTPMLTSAPCVDAVVIEDAGHSLNLHRNAQEVFAAINTYAWQQCLTS